MRTRGTSIGKGSQSAIFGALFAVLCMACADLPSAPPRLLRTTITRIGDAPWSGRDSFGAVLTPAGGDSVLIFGGFTPERSQETWISGNLGHWIAVPATDETPSPRNGHCMLTHRGQIIVVGGFDGLSMLSDVYSSFDGRSWTRLVDAPFIPRAFFGCVSLNGFIYVYGGNIDGNLASNDVWRSADGESWERISPATAWMPRGMFASFVHRGRMWLVGGGVYDSRYVVNVKNNYADAWSSADGVSWENISMPDGFSPRRFMGAQVVSATVFLVGGFELDRRLFSSQHTGILRDGPDVPELFRLDPLKAGRDFGNLREVWFSTDMIQWQQVDVPAGFLARHAPGVVAMQGRLVILGGFGSDLFNDIWVGSAVQH